MADENRVHFQSEAECKWNEALCPRCSRCVNTVAISCKYCNQYFAAVRIPRKILEKFVEEGELS